MCSCQLSQPGEIATRWAPPACAVSYGWLGYTLTIPSFLAFLTLGLAVGLCLFRRLCRRDRVMALIGASSAADVVSEEFGDGNLNLVFRCR